MLRRIVPRYHYKSTLEASLKASVLKEENKGCFCLFMDKLKVMELSRDGSSVTEHLGYFHETAKALRLPYQKVVDAFANHYRQLLKVNP